MLNVYCIRLTIMVEKMTDVIYEVLDDINESVEQYLNCSVKELKQSIDRLHAEVRIKNRILNFFEALKIIFEPLSDGLDEYPEKIIFILKYVDLNNDLNNIFVKNKFYHLLKMRVEPLNFGQIKLIFEVDNNKVETLKKVL